MHSIDVNTSGWPTPVSACTHNWNLKPQDVENWDTGGVRCHFSCRTCVGLKERADLATLVVNQSIASFFSVILPADDVTTENHFHVPLFPLLLQRAWGLYCCDVRTSELTSSRRVPSKKAVQEFSAKLQWSVRSLGSWQSTKYLTVTLAGCFWALTMFKRPIVNGMAVFTFLILFLAFK